MQIVIVEDEKPAADKLARLLQKIIPEVTILATLESVEEAVNWFENNTKADILFMDIQLDDGLCFEIFETVKVNTPVIFTTAYDQYAIEAFRVNSIDYLLKPIEEKKLQTAITKYKGLHSDRVRSLGYSQIMNHLPKTYKTRFLVKIGMKFKSILTSEIQYFYINQRNVFLRSQNNKDYALDFSLDQLLKNLDPNDFYRINRNCIVNINSINEMFMYSSSRLQLKIGSQENDELFVVSRDKVSDFKRWMDR